MTLDFKEDLFQVYRFHWFLIDTPTFPNLSHLCFKMQVVTLVGGLVPEKDKNQQYKEMCLFSEKIRNFQLFCAHQRGSILDVPDCFWEDSMLFLSGLQKQRSQIGVLYVQDKGEPFERIADLLTDYMQGQVAPFILTGGKLCLAHAPISEKEKKDLKTINDFPLNVITALDYIDPQMIRPVIKLLLAKKYSLSDPDTVHDFQTTFCIITCSSRMFGVVQQYAKSYRTEAVHLRFPSVF